MFHSGNRPYLFDVSANQQRQFLRDEVGKVDERLTVGRVAAQDEDLGAVVLDVVRHVVQRLDVLQGGHELQGLGRRAPVGV